MQTLKELYKIGNGPSSSHTMGPKRATEYFRDKNKDATRFKVILYGSLALTGKGHLTDYIISKVLEEYEHEIIFDTVTECPVHPNTFDIFAYNGDKLKDKIRIYSVGGGTYEIDGEEKSFLPDIYKHTHWDDIKAYCKEKNIDLFEYAVEVEDKDIQLYLMKIWNTMESSINRGLSTEGKIPGRLKINRRAKSIYEQERINEDEMTKRTRLLSSYAYAVSEENASGGEIVTAPTCGSAGVLPATLLYMKNEYDLDYTKIIKALAVAGIIGNLIKTNASISGAECGCQAEIGSACSMAAGACAYLLGLDIERIENAAEIAMEHHLGLTCDPIYGYVQIPCIERNAVAAMRAVDSAVLSSVLNQHSSISLDMVIDTMYETGKDLQSHYRETSEGGLAKKYCRNKYYNKELKE